MQRTSPAYFAAYQSLKLTRDGHGVLLVEFHTNGGPLTFKAQDHTEFVDAFFRIEQDRANNTVILAGTGGEFTPGIDFPSFLDPADPDVCTQGHDVVLHIIAILTNNPIPIPPTLPRPAPH